MPRVVIPVFVVLVGLMPAAGAAAQPRTGGTDLAANAALKYWQAFAHLPPRNDEEQRRIGDWRATPLDATARRLVEDSQNSFLYLRRGRVTAGGRTAGSPAHGRHAGTDTHHGTRLLQRLGDPLAEGTGTVGRRRPASEGQGAAPRLRGIGRHSAARGRQLGEASHPGL